MLRSDDKNVKRKRDTVRCLFFTGCIFELYIFGYFFSSVQAIIDIKYWEGVRTSLFLSTLLYIAYRGRNVEDTFPIYFESVRI